MRQASEQNFLGLALGFMKIGSPQFKQSPFFPGDLIALWHTDLTVLGERESCFPI